MSEPDVSGLLTVDEAIAVLDATPVQARVVSLALADAQGMVLAEDLSADRDYPPFDKALMDGYAVRCADVAGAPVELDVVGEIAAGGYWGGAAIGVGQAVAIMTGASVPAGADGIVPVEETQAVGSRVRVMRAASAGRYVSRRGADVKQGERVLQAGVRLEAAQLAAAATVGAARVRVYAAPRVGVLATGDEIVAIDGQPGATQIRNSNSIMLVALLGRMGCHVTDLGLVKDDPQQIRAMLLKAAEMDAVFVTGGMSMGRYDYVPRIVAELGAQLRVTKLRIKPGKPFLFATLDRAQEAKPATGEQGGTCFIFGLPGNPVSGFVCTLRLAARVLARLAGAKPTERWLPARLATALGPNGPREFYQPVRLEWGREGIVAWPLEWKGSADVFTLAQCDGLIRRVEAEPAKAAGDAVSVLEVGAPAWSSGRSS